jgi:CubicO group peptidase (beta-lactamase class C family)
MDVKVSPSYIDQVCSTFNIPGVAVGIFQNVESESKTYLKGFGTLKTEENIPVDENTIFGCASLTKAFVVASFAILIDEGKCQWNDTIISHLPTFSVQDSYITNEITIRDMLCHRSGLPEGAGDLLFWPNSQGRTMDDVINALKHMKVTHKFRDSFNYNNSFYMLAGLLIEIISGIPWPQFFEKRIFSPLGMTNTRATIIDFINEKNSNIATPHCPPPIKINEDYEEYNKKKLLPYPEMLVGEALQLGPCGSVGSCVSDMVKWIRALLDKGQPLFSEKQFTEMFKIQVGINNGSSAHPDQRTSFSGYALAWNVREYKNNIYWNHGGGLTGMICKLIVVPKLNFGFIILLNTSEGSGINAIIYHTFDHFIAGKSIDEFANNNEKDYHFEACYSERDNNFKGRQRQLEQIYASKPTDTKPLELGEYVGTYSDAWFGLVFIKLVESKDGNELEITFDKSPFLKCKLSHWANNSFVLAFDERLDANAFIDFHTAENKNVDSFKLRRFDSYIDFSYDYENTHFHKKS